MIPRQLDAVALNTREADFKSITFGADRSYVDRLPRDCWLNDYRFSRKVKGDAKDVGILNIRNAPLRSARRTGVVAPDR